MTNQDMPRFISAMTAMSVVFKEPLSQPLVETYFRVLSGFDADQVDAGISKAISTLKFWPKPVELVECISGGGLRLEDKAQVEACRVLEAIKSIGTYSSVAFDDAVTQAVIVQQFGGWAKFSEMRAVDEKWFVKDFAAAYQAFARANVKHYGALSGVASCQNALTGRPHDEKPVYIGDVEKAKAIHAQGKLNALPDGEGLRHIGAALGNWKRPASRTEQ